MNIFVAKTNNVCFLQNSVGCCVDTSICLVVLGEPDLGLGIDAEVRKLGLSTDSDFSADVSHLEGLLSEVPLVPVMVRIDMLINEMQWCLLTLVNH